MIHSFTDLFWKSMGPGTKGGLFLVLLSIAAIVPVAHFVKSLGIDRGLPRGEEDIEQEDLEEEEPDEGEEEQAMGEDATVTFTASDWDRIRRLMNGSLVSTLCLNLFLGGLSIWALFVFFTRHLPLGSLPVAPLAH